MWAKNLFFVGLCFAGLAALAATLFDAQPSTSSQERRWPPAHDSEFDMTVAKVDAAFQTSWRDDGLEPVSPAPDLAIARRLSLALAGTIPSVEEIRALEEQSPEGRIEWWLSGIFADRRYADYLAERLARPVVGTENGPFLLYRRRRFVAWLADQLHQNRPYDQITREIVASQGLWTDQPATNFVTVSLVQDDGNKPDVNKLAGRVSRAFLGIRLDCAQCHDHPFEDRWKQKDFQALAAFFAGTEVSLTGIRDTGRPYQVEDHNTRTEQVVAAAVPFGEQQLPEEGRNRERLATWITHPQNALFARATVNRLWALMFGRPLIEPVDDLPIDGPFPPALEALASDFSAHGFDLQRLIRAIAATQVFQLDSRAPRDRLDFQISADHDEAWAVFPLTRLRPEQVVGGLLQSASLTTIDYESHILVRIARATGLQEFVERYGDLGELELEPAGGTIPQRLLMLNGNLIHEKTKDNLLANAATRIAQLAPDDQSAIEAAYLAVLTRRPTPGEASHFAARLEGASRKQRNDRLADLYWTLMNSTEFSWNH